MARYYRGRAEATGFSVADHAVEGHLAQALEQLRWALATGIVPGPDQQRARPGVRLLGRVGAAPRGASRGALAAEVGAPPWKIDRVRQQLRGWHPDGVARALQAVAEADAQVKGEASQRRVRPGARGPPDRRLPRRRLTAERSQQYRPGPSAIRSRRDLVTRSRAANGAGTLTHDLRASRESSGAARLAWSSASRLAIADLRFAAWFLWMTPLLARPCPACGQAARSAVAGLVDVPRVAASRNLRT